MAIMFGKLLCMCLLALACAPGFAAPLNAGAAVVDITPEEFPVFINGGMLSRTADDVVMPIKARAIVADDGARRVAIVVADSCMMPRDLLDEAKAMAAERTGIPPENMLIAATHTHTAPAAMGCLGTDADPNYVPFLKEKLAEAIVAAEANLEPARVGWASADAEDHTAIRRWVRRPDRVVEDPFGNATVRANMHAAGNLDDVTGESGPIDPELSLISFQSETGRPIAVLASFSMHYFSGVSAIHPDYFGLFAEGLQERVAPDGGEHPPFVAMMAHGCSGDIWRRDYRDPAPEALDTIDGYTESLLDIAEAAYADIAHDADADIAMAETRLPLDYQTPNAQLLEWARRIVDEMGDRLPENREEVYAREQVFLDEWQTTEIVLQALRIGDMAIAATPTETYALTGLKIKLQSPLTNTMTLDLANGGDGYIAPPEQHVLGGYNTWPARSAGLKPDAEPQITEAVLQLLEETAGQPRRAHEPSRGPAAEAVLDLDPAVYWRLGDFAGPFAKDSSGHNRPAMYEPGVVFFLEGPRSEAFRENGEINRAAHFAGGRLHARLPNLGAEHTVSLWFWNGMPVDGREVTGWMLSHDRYHGAGPHGVHVGIGGAGNHAGRLLLQRGEDVTAGATSIERWTWNHLALVRDGEYVRVYLNGNPEPEIEVETTVDNPPGMDDWFFGGRSDNAFNWEGRLGEIAVFDRALSAEEAAALAGE